MKKLNCWEFLKCGRELGGAKAGARSVCPAAMEARLNGTHGGRCGGRACWVVSHTLCSGTSQGTFAEKARTCEHCLFYQAVKREEGLKLILSPVLLHRIHQLPRVLRPASPNEAA